MTNLIQWFQQQLASGAANGWQSFGQSSAENSKELGQDIGEPVGTSIPGVAGTVQSVTPWGYGDSAVTIKDKLGNLFTVGHVTPNVLPGQQVTDGQTIGYSRGLPSPISSGPHVEVQVTPAGDSSTVNTVTWLKDWTSSSPAIAQPQAIGRAQGQASVPGSNIPVIGGLIGMAALLFGGLFRVILTILGIIAILIGFYLLFKPDDAPGVGDAAKMAGKAMLA